MPLDQHDKAAQVLRDTFTEYELSWLRRLADAAAHDPTIPINDLSKLNPQDISCLWRVNRKLHQVLGPDTFRRSKS